MQVARDAHALALPHASASRPCVARSSALTRAASSRARRSLAARLPAPSEKISPPATQTTVTTASTGRSATAAIAARTAVWATPSQTARPDGKRKAASPSTGKSSMTAELRGAVETSPRDAADWTSSQASRRWSSHRTSPQVAPRQEPSQARYRIPRAGHRGSLSADGSLDNSASAGKPTPSHVTTVATWSGHGTRRDGMRRF
jgi:hypothetical protein